MQPDPNARPEYIGAFREIVERITGTLSALPRRALPIKMYVAGGAYRDGAARLLYFDRQYSDTCALRHEDAYDDSVLLSLEGHDDRVLEVRLLSALDLAVSKLGRFSSQDRDDITALARRKFIEVRPAAVTSRASFKCIRRQYGTRSGLYRDRLPNCLGSRATKNKNPALIPYGVSFRRRLQNKHHFVLACGVRRGERQVSYSIGAPVAFDNTYSALLQRATVKLQRVD
jgi:hypothetical protein